MSAKEAVREFFDAISDLTSLEVTTYTGTLAEAVDAETGQIQWDSFKPTEGKLVLAAATLIRPNLHTVNFQAESLEKGDLEALQKLHMAAVESAQKNRLALAKMLAGMFPTGADI